MTSFPHCPEHIRPILDEFLVAMRLVMENPVWFPMGEDKLRIIAGGHKLYNSQNGYEAGFVTWAIPKFCKIFPDTRYIPSPYTLRFLYERYKPEKTGQSFDELMDEALEKDRRKSKWTS